MKQKSGFTLVEIMIVVAIIALLAGLAVPSVIKQRSTARKTICINNLRQIDSAKEQYALAANLNTDSEITAEGIDSYIKGGTAKVICPADKDKSFATSYDIKPVGTDPACKIDSTGHKP